MFLCAYYSINNKLQQPDAATGVLEYARRHVQADLVSYKLYLYETLHIRMYVYMYVCMYVCMHVCMYACMYVCVCITYTCTYI